MYAGCAHNLLTCFKFRACRALLQAGAHINHQDTDGWTPLHGAAHWGQEESCKILCDGLCDMEIKDYAGRTAHDVADDSLVKLLKELEVKQKSVSDHCNFSIRYML